MRKYKYQPVEVLWDDAESDASWSEVPLAPLKPTLALTIGFLVVDEPDYILVADTYFMETDSKTISNTTKIPRAMIKEIHPLSIAHKKEKRQRLTPVNRAIGPTPAESRANPPPQVAESPA